MSTLSNSLVELDRRHFIHPVGSPHAHERKGVRVLKSGKGAAVTDSTGRQLVDGFAGLWCVNAGYGHEAVVEMRGLEALRDHPLVGEVRGRGMLAAVELVVDNFAKKPLPSAAMPATRISIAPGTTA